MRSHSLFCGGKGKRRPQHCSFDEKIRRKSGKISLNPKQFLSLFKVSKEFSPLCVCVCVWHHSLCGQAPVKSKQQHFV